MKKTTLTNVFAIFLVSAMITTSILLPVVDAHSPPWQIPTYAYLSVTPNPVGVGQQLSIVMMLDKVLMGSTIDNDVRFRDFAVNITKPDGTLTILGPFQPESTSSTFAFYTPDQIGIYSFVFSHPGITYIWDRTTTERTWTNDTYLGSTSNIVYVTVQEEPIPDAISSYPLPTEYWTRPIEGQNTDWYTISSNWLGGSHQIHYNVQPDGLAPNTPHIMWTKRLEAGGVVGGSNVGPAGNTFYSGMSYEMRFSNPLIINGILFYDTPLSNSPSAGPYIAVDLRTGETLWSNQAISPTFGQLVTFDTGNQHGVIPNGYLWQASGTTLMAYDPLSGNGLFNLTGVPSGTNYYGPSGELLRYRLDNTNHWLALWNFSKVFDTAIIMSQYRPIGQSINAGDAYSWNVSIPTLPSGATISWVIPNDRIIGTHGGYVSYLTGSNFGTPDPYTFWAISIKPESRGQLLWSKSYPAPAGNQSVYPVAHDEENRIFIMYNKETQQFSGYSIDDGSLKWTTNYQPAPFDYYVFGALIASVYNGRLYHSSFGGILYTFDISNGKLLWTYGNGGPGNSTNAGLATVYGNYPMFISNIADDKVYLFTSEHSPDAPPYKGARLRCVNATDGTELWTMLSWPSSTSFYARGGVIADGYLAYYNAYDGQVYSIGKGPSAMTVEAPSFATKLGDSIVIRGTVTDIAAGTKQAEQAARFPNGVPAVSDASMGRWMEYVYMQKPRPTDTVGVPVTISVVDSNGNYRDIGTTITSDGFFSFNWKPDIEGQYTVYASFGGSESYWPSHAMSSFAVDPAAATPVPPQEPIASMADTYLLPGIIAIIVAIGVVGAVLALLVTRKRP